MFANILGWFKESPVRRQPLGLPPRYEEIVPGQTEDDYRDFAKLLVKKHYTIEHWFLGTKGNPIVEDITAFAKGKSLPARSQQYVYEQLDQFGLVMEYVDFLVDEAGLRHASGAENCNAWDWKASSKRYTHADIQAIRQLRDKRITKIVCPFNSIGAMPHLPYYYLAACVHETDLAELRRESLLHKIDLLDKRFALLGHLHRCRGAEDFIGSSPGEKNDGLAKFRFLLAESRRGGHDFQKSFSREAVKLNFRKSDAFVDELFGISAGSKRRH